MVRLPVMTVSFVLMSFRSMLFKPDTLRYTVTQKSDSMFGAF